MKQRNVNWPNWFFNQVGLKFNSLMVLIALTCAIMALTIVKGHAQESWRGKVGTFRIGMIRDTSTNPDPKLLKDVEQQFSNALNMPAQITLFSNYSTLIDAQVTGRVLYGIYSAQSFATLQVHCDCVIPLVAPKLTNGATGTIAVLVANGQRMPNLLDMTDRKIAWPDNPSATNIMLADESLRVLGAPIAPQSPFLAFYATQNAMLSELANDAIDGALLSLNGQPEDSDDAVLGRINEMVTAQGRAPAANLNILWRSGFLAFGPHALSKSVPDDVRSNLMDMLAAIDDAENPILTLFNEGFGGGYQNAKMADYAPAIAHFSKF